MKSLQQSSLLRLVYFGFFASHIPITLILGGQASCFGMVRRWYPTALQEGRAWYAETYRDGFFVFDDEDNMTWFSSLATMELVLQLPYFILACRQLWKFQPSQAQFPEWFRLVSLMYGATTVTTLVPILTHILFSTNNDDNFGTLESRRQLFGFYLPYLLLPLGMIFLSRGAESNDNDTTTATFVKPSLWMGYISLMGFLISHIPATIIVDSQAAPNGIIPDSWHPTWANKINDWYAAQTMDPCMTRPYQVWFSSLIACEVLMQFPYFIVAIYYFWNIQTTTTKETTISLPRWFQTASILYGTHTATTLIPILATVWINPIAPIGKKILTTSIYLPYLLVPLYIVYLASAASIFSVATTTRTSHKKVQ